MVRIGVYNGRTKKRGLTLLNFTVLNDLEITNVQIPSFNLVGRYNNYKENLIEKRIYLVNLKDDPRNPVKNYEILDKCKYIKYVDGEYLLTYKRYRNQNLIDLYENRREEAQEFIDWTLKRGKVSKRVRLNTFSKTILEKLFHNYGYENVIRYDSKDELKNWNKEITQKVKNFNKKIDDKSTTWSDDEIEQLKLNMDKPGMTEKKLAAMLGRTVPSIATMKWKIKHEYKSKLKNMKDKAEIISDKLKNFREEHGWSQRKLVEESGISLSVINQLECRNYGSINGPTTQKLLDFVDTYGKNGNDNTENVEETKEAVMEPKKSVPVTKQAGVEELSETTVDAFMVRLDSLTREIGRLNENMEKLVKTQSDQLRKDKLLSELRELTHELQPA